jgi:hypothetical protein
MHAIHYRYLRTADAWTEVRRISGLISFEPDKVEVARARQP